METQMHTDETEFRFARDVVNAGVLYAAGAVARMAQGHARRLEKVGFGEVVEAKVGKLKIPKHETPISHFD